MAPKSTLTQGQINYYRTQPFGTGSALPGGFGLQYQAVRKRVNPLQNDLGMASISPMLLSAVLNPSRRRGFGGTILTGALGLDEERTKRKTLLGG